MVNTPNKILEKKIGEFTKQRMDDTAFLLGDKNEIRKRNAIAYLKYGNMDYYQKLIDKESLAKKENAEEIKERLKILYSVANKDFVDQLPTINEKILVPYLKNSDMKRDSIQTTLKDFNVDKNTWDAIMAAVGGAEASEYSSRKAQESQRHNTAQT
jgi:hypothetical protein